MGHGVRTPLLTVIQSYQNQGHGFKVKSDPKIPHHLVTEMKDFLIKFVENGGFTELIDTADSIYKYKHFSLNLAKWEIEFLLS